MRPSWAQAGRTGVRLEALEIEIPRGVHPSELKRAGSPQIELRTPRADRRPLERSALPARGRGEDS
jgi:hypothetical protein